MEFIQIGFTKKSHGITGEIKVTIEEKFEDLFLESERVYIDNKGAKMPYFLEEVRGGGDLIVKFEDIQNRDQAIHIQSKAIFLPSKEVPASVLIAEEPTSEYGFLLGYMITDVQVGAIGTIEEMIEMPHQEMAVVTYKKKEILIPISASLVVSVDRDLKAVLMNLPDGLLDL